MSTRLERSNRFQFCKITSSIGKDVLDRFEPNIHLRSSYHFIRMLIELGKYRGP
jgi:hypothetical protein